MKTPSSTKCLNHGKLTIFDSKLLLLWKVHINRNMGHLTMWHSFVISKPVFIVHSVRFHGTISNNLNFKQWIYNYHDFAEF